MMMMMMMIFSPFVPKTYYYFKRFAHSAEPNRLVVGMLGSWLAVWFSAFLVAVLLSCCLAASLACLLKKLKNCSKVDPKSSPEGPKLKLKLGRNHKKEQSGTQNDPRAAPGEISSDFYQSPSSIFNNFGMPFGSRKGPKVNPWTDKVPWVTHFEWIL